MSLGMEFISWHFQVCTKQPTVLKHLLKHKRHQHVELQPPPIHRIHGLAFKTMTRKPMLFRLRSFRPQKLRWPGLVVTLQTKELSHNKQGKNSFSAGSLRLWHTLLNAFTSPKYQLTLGHSPQSAALLHNFHSFHVGVLLQHGKILRYKAMTSRRNWRFPPPCHKLQC